MQDFKIIIGNKNYSSWSLRGWLALELSGFEYEEVMLPLDTDRFYEQIAQLNPAGKVPALYHGTTLIWDSLAIVDYMDRLAPELELWPKDLAAFAKARSMSAEMHSGLTAIRSAMPMNLRAQWSGFKIEVDVEREIRRVETLWTQTLSEFSEKGPYLFGEKFSGADIMFAPVVTRFLSYGIEVNAVCKSYMNAVMAHPAMLKWKEAALQETQIVSHDEIDPNTGVLSSKKA